MEENGKIHKLVESAGNYVDSSIDVIKLQTADRLSKILASVISDLLMIAVGIMFVLFASLGLSFYLSDLIGYSYAGFMITAAIYLVVGLVLLMLKTNGMEHFFRNRIIRKIFGTEDDGKS